MSHRRGENYQAFGLQILCEGRAIELFDTKTTGTTPISAPQNSNFLVFQYSLSKLLSISVWSILMTLLINS
ncbi:MAG: hypothetical protein GX270_09025 [Clostridiaceae bacterium]|nr:hypothetical protein [Clostridiaceae bacterium]